MYIGVRPRPWAWMHRTAISGSIVVHIMFIHDGYRGIAEHGQAVTPFLKPLPVIRDLRVKSPDTVVLIA